MVTSTRKLRVLIVDDSAIVRRILTETLSSEPDIEVVGSAPNPFEARDMILALKPDVLTLDIEMPRMDGVSFLKALMLHHPLPVVMISSVARHSAAIAMDALEAGAVEVVTKPNGPYSVGDLKLTLASKVRAAGQAKLRLPTSQKPASPLRAKSSGAGPSRPIIAIGASTGGTEAIRAILEQFPEQSPPIVIVQHIPAGFSRAFADRLNRTCSIQVREAEDGDMLVPGLALVAPGDRHMLIRQGATGLKVQIKNGPPVCYQRPSVDVLFQSVAEAIGAKAIGVILTGMGRDGARGLLSMREAGAHTMAQDGKSCVVYGMPKEAIRINAACRTLPLDEIAAAILASVRTNPTTVRQ